MTNGYFITFEGCEGSGKSTQLQKLQQWLLGEGEKWIDPFSELVVTREPGGTLLGQQIRTLLLDSSEQALIHSHAELLLFAADRAQHVETFLKPKLAEGALILCDRFTDSTIAYQGYGRRLSINLIETLNTIATAGLKPNLTLWLDVDVKTGLSRARSRGLNRIDSISVDFHQRVQAGYGKLSQQHPDRIVQIDANPDTETVALQIQKALGKALQSSHKL